MTSFAIAFAIVWGGMWWRLRGGAFTAITGIDPGTGGMRAIAAVGMTAPLAFVDPLWLALAPAFWVAWSLAGWGAFQSMGESPVDKGNWLAVDLERAGASSSLANDLIGMALEGWMVMSVPAIVVWCLQGVDTAAVVALSGLMFSPIYLIAQRSPRLPDFGRFANAGSEWAEVFVGAWVGLVLAVAAVMSH